LNPADPQLESAWFLSFNPWSYQAKSRFLKPLLSHATCTDVYVKDCMERRLYGYVHRLYTHGAPIERLTIGAGCEEDGNEGLPVKVAQTSASRPRPAPAHDAPNAHNGQQQQQQRQRKKQRMSCHGGGRCITPAAPAAAHARVERGGAARAALGRVLARARRRRRRQRRWHHGEPVRARGLGGEVLINRKPLYLSSETVLPIK
jgi:hypothetical protein